MWPSYPAVLAVLCHGWGKTVFCNVLRKSLQYIDLFMHKVGALPDKQQMFKLYSSKKWCFLADNLWPKYRPEVRVAVIPHFPLVVVGEYSGGCSALYCCWRVYTFFLFKSAPVQLRLVRLHCCRQLASRFDKTCFVST